MARYGLTTISCSRKVGTEAITSRRQFEDELCVGDAA